MEELLQYMSNVLGLVKMIGVFDVVDMIIVAFVAYHILVFVRRSRSGQVFQAIVLLLLAFAVANALNLRVVKYIMSNVLELGLIALAIIFQPEIRRGLERMGSGKLKELFVAESVAADVPEAIEQTVDAYTSMSKDKVGALMVFERKTMLDDVIKSGTQLDAAVSSELLKNLFWNKAPLHDGAVIVRNGRIVGAGCMLPLSGNTNLSRDLGMRHRAGIGISENSDAVVAIVSEETGSISVAINGMLKRHLSPETLDRLLRNELAPDVEEKKAPATVRFPGVFKPKRGDKGNGKENS
jgi:diadenylate cyclase